MAIMRHVSGKILKPLTNDTKCCCRTGGGGVLGCCSERTPLIDADVLITTYLWNGTYPATNISRFDPQPQHTTRQLQVNIIPGKLNIFPLNSAYSRLVITGQQSFEFTDGGRTKEISVHLECPCDIFFGTPVKFCFNAVAPLPNSSIAGGQIQSCNPFLVSSPAGFTWKQPFTASERFWEYYDWNGIDVTEL